MKRIAALCLTMAALCADPILALADDALGEILVTAQRRSESVQTVPLSITVLDSAALENQDIKSFIDYATMVPNLGFGYTGVGFANARSISIRGIAGANTTGFYIDDTPLPNSVDPRIVDIDRIEVLRGPQGTLYGARSEGGTVRLITTQPDATETSGRVHAGLSDTWNTVKPNYNVDGAVNIPIVPGRVALRLVGLLDYEAGFFRRTFPVDPPFGTQLTSVNNVADNRVGGGSATLKIQVTDDFTVTPRFMYQKTTYDGFPYSDHTAYDIPPPAVAPTNLNLNPNNFVQQRLYNLPEGGVDRWSLSSLTLEKKTGFGTFVSSSSYFDRSLFETEDVTDYTYQLLEYPFFNPVSGGTTLHEFVQEFRFTSSFTGPLQLVTGLWFEQSRGYPLYQPATVDAGLNAYFGGTPTSPAEGTDPANPDLVNEFTSHQKETEYALYGELSYQITDPLKAIVGARVYRDKIEGGDVETGLIVGGPPLIGAPVSLTQSGVNPKVELDYQLTPDKMIYASAAKGFRPGGLSNVVPTAFGCDQSLAAIGITQAQARQFSSDSLWSYELGGKTEWLDRRLIVNGAVYTIDWKNLQQQVELACGFAFTANVGSAKSQGAELEIQARPVPSLQLSGGIGYEHAYITASGTTSPQQAGSPVYQVPNITGNLSATHTLPLNAELNLISNLSYSYVGHSYSGNNNPFDPRVRAAYRLLDSRIALGWGRYEAAFVGRNLTNEHANLADDASQGAEVVGRPRMVTNQPRTLGVEFAAKF